MVIEMRKNLKRIACYFSIVAFTLSLFVLPVRSNAVGSYDSDVYVDVADPTSIIGELYEDEFVTFTVENVSEDGVSPQDFHIPNKLVGVLQPGKTGYAIMVKNLGVDAISSLTLTLIIRDYNNNHVATKVFYDSNVKVGLTTYTWSFEKSATIRETATISGNAVDGVTYQIPAVTTYRNNFAGGAYGAMEAYEGQRHHIPSDSINDLTTYSGPAIRMLTEDHENTASYGNTASARNYRVKEAQLIADGRFDEAMQMGIDDVRKLYGSKYDDAIDEMIAYAVLKGYITAGSVS